MLTHTEPDLSGHFPTFEPNKALACMGGQTVYLRVLEKFIPNRGGMVQAIQTALAENDIKQAEGLVHTLKGIAATIGAYALSETARLLELAIRQELADQYPQRLAAAEAEMTQVIACVEAYLRENQTAPAPQAPAADLKPLLQQLATQLQAFDSEASNTMLQIKQQAGTGAPADRLEALERAIDAYDYENALLETQRLAGIPT